ncbi:glycoside hydrolase family 3 N-terminal domain-containing protein [Allomuricauda taeanensis]|uniref:glycoside hydrolase family 3 protein n=1 Tax=Flagellimonas taeanensis TaxID=1005926 RepID=UPI002E7AC541|nr:glycoside hydrolase family 3 N-terminal domain-containing protein [Allomuricauda taeanensis]MEE1962798.1 glycoside hydrolase family 3 N-terminal domain-containing protein [Allomuricauda taeanensis]
MTDTHPTYTLSKKELTLRQKVGQLFMPAVFINDTEEEVQKMERLIKEHHVGSICFFHSRASAATNFEGKKKVVHNAKSHDRLKELITRYQKASEIPLLVAIDAEWGLAMRIENTPQFPYAITLGALNGDENLIQQVGQHIGWDCRAAGIQWNLAPVVDINNNPENPVIGYRSFGENKEMVLAKSEAFIQGMKSTGTLNSIKHFPGHGDTAVDSHLGLPVIDKSLSELKENELFPFQELINKGVDSVMVGHLSLPQLDDQNPSTTSSKIITGLLRKQMGFEGVIISDALNMHAVSKKYPKKGKLEQAAFEAGMDVLCFSENVAEGIQLILDTTTEERIDESFDRVWRLKKKAFAMDKEMAKPSDGSAFILNRNIALKSITELYGNPSGTQKFKAEGFLNISCNNGKENIFSQKLEDEFGVEPLDIALQTDIINEKIKATKNVVLSLFPPAVKPKDQFGFDTNVLETVKKWINDNNTLIYLFGNPYVLDLLGLKPTSNVVVVYQDFPEFQEVAAEHFKGAISAKGTLPIQLKTFQA